MDANHTRFHLLLGYDDWASCTGDQGHSLRSLWSASSGAGGQLAWDTERHELTLKPSLFQFIAAQTDRPPTPDDRRGAARDRYGNWYWIDETRRKIRVYSAGSGERSDFWPVTNETQTTPAKHFGGFQPRQGKPAPTPASLEGLTITDDHYLVVGVLEPAGLLIFDLHAGGAPLQQFWPETVAFAPFDMAPKPGGGVWILDRDHKRYWALDRRFNVIRQDQAETALAPEETEVFQPKEGGPPRPAGPRTFPEGIVLDVASPITAFDPIAIEALPDSSVLILDRNPGGQFSLVRRYRFGQPLGEPISTGRMADLIEEGSAQTLRLIGHDFGFVPKGDSRVDGRVYITSNEGNQTFAFDLVVHGDQLELQPFPQYLPMRAFSGRALVAAGAGVYYDFGERWVPLVEQQRPRYEIEAAFETRVFDGREPDCVWHRLMLDACIPNRPETMVRIWSRAANEAGDLTFAEWQAEPSLYLRGDGSELPFTRKPTAAGSGTWELLFQRVRGRYMQLRLTLTGNGRSTPRLRALRAYYPRFSYLDHYLPGVYREDRESASFLGRFLANLEGFYTALEDKIAAVQVLFDVRSAPVETLEWLAGWFGVRSAPAETLEWLASWFDMALDPAWDEARRRLFIQHAMDFFQYRGTMRGLRIALRLALDDCPDESIFSDTDLKSARPAAVRIVERFRTRRTPGVVFGDPTELGGLRLVLRADRWLPVHGREELARRYNLYAQLVTQLRQGTQTEAASRRLYQAALRGDDTALPLSAPEPFPIRDPGAEKSSIWRQFAQETLGFVPSATAADKNRWQEFLARRYQRISTLNNTYRANWNAFAEVPVPDDLPPDNAPLQDWYQFEAVVLAMRRTAHRFTVMIPAPKTDTANLDEHRRRQELATRVVEMEKPAHTIFEVKFYWALFRVGEARLGLDTLIDLGSRAPQLMPPMILGQGHLLGNYLAPSHPQDIADRHVLGRDGLGQSKEKHL